MGCCPLRTVPRRAVPGVGVGVGAGVEPEPAPQPARVSARANAPAAARKGDPDRSEDGRRGIRVPEDLNELWAFKERSRDLDCRDASRRARVGLRWVYGCGSAQVGGVSSGGEREVDARAREWGIRRIVRFGLWAGGGIRFALACIVWARMETTSS